MIGTLLTLAGLGTSAWGQLAAGRRAKAAGYATAAAIEDTGRRNAQLILEGAALNAEVEEFNARIFEAASTDALARGRETEWRFRQQIRALIGSQRASYAAQGVDTASGSALEVQMDTAREAELDALTIRTNAAREAWGYQVEAQGSRLRAAHTRRLGRLEAANVRDVARAEALNARLGGNYAASAARWGVAATLATGAADIYRQRKYGAR